MELLLTKDLKREILEQAKDQAVQTLLHQIRAELNTKQIVAEVKNLVVKEAAKDLSKLLGEQYKISSVVEKAIQSAESRVNQKITDLLNRGITVKFTD